MPIKVAIPQKQLKQVLTVPRVKPASNHPVIAISEGGISCSHYNPDGLYVTRSWGDPVSKRRPAVSVPEIELRAVRGRLQGAEPEVHITSGMLQITTSTASWKLAVLPEDAPAGPDLARVSQVRHFTATECQILGNVVESDPFRGALQWAVADQEHDCWWVTDSYTAIFVKTDDDIAFPAGVNRLRHPAQGAPGAVSGQDARPARAGSRKRGARRLGLNPSEGRDHRKWAAARDDHAHQGRPVRRSPMPPRRAPLGRRAGLKPAALSSTAGNGEPQRRAPLRRISPKQSAHRKEVVAAQDIALARDRYTCQVPAIARAMSAQSPTPEQLAALASALAVQCTIGVDPQHKATQGSRRDLSTDPRNIIALCRAHHIWTGNHPAFGRILGTYGTTIKHPEENPPT